MRIDLRQFTSKWWDKWWDGLRGWLVDISKYSINTIAFPQKFNTADKSKGQVLLVAFATKRSIIWLLAFGQVSVRLYISGKDGTSFGRDSQGSFCVVNICACGWILLGLSKVPVLSTTKPLGATWYSHQTNVPHLEQKWGSYPAPLPVGKVVDFVSPFILNPDLVVRVWITKALPVEHWQSTQWHACVKRGASFSS